MNTPETRDLHLTTGLSHRERMIVTQAHTVPHVAPEWPGFVDMPPVFATAMMIGFVEQTCVTALRRYLSEGQATVGTHIDMSHLAATPEGVTVTAEITVTEVKGRTLHFDVACYDEQGLIGSGTHRRAVVDTTAFIQRAADRLSGPTT